MRESFIFYASFFEAIKELPDDEQLRLYQAISEYALTGIEPELSGVSKAMFILIKPQIEANNQRYDNGCKGGRKPKANQNKTESEPNDNRNVTEIKPNNNQNETESEPNKNVNVNDNDNVNEKEKRGKEKVADAPSPAPDDFFDDENLPEDVAGQIPKDAKPCRFENSVFFIPLESPQKSPVPFSWAGDDMGFSEGEIYGEYASFRDYWLGVSGSKGVKKDWLATWRNWLRRTREWKADRRQA